MRRLLPLILLVACRPAPEPEGTASLAVLANASVQALASTADAMAWGDWDADGILDLAVGVNGDSNQVHIYLGDGTFSSRNTIEVGGQTLKFKKACIATGARATAPPIPGLDTVDYLTNETVFSLTELPPTIAIFGAGPIGCELAQSFVRFGSEVTLIEAMHGILPSEDADAAEFVKQSLLRALVHTAVRW